MQPLNVPIENTKLSEITKKRLINGCILTIGDLIKKTEAGLFEIRNFGEKDLTEIYELLKEAELQLSPKSSRHPSASGSNPHSPSSPTPGA